MSSVDHTRWNLSNLMQTSSHFLSGRTARSSSCQRLMDNSRSSLRICQNKQILSRAERTSPVGARPTTALLHQTARPAKHLRVSLGMRMDRAFSRAVTASTSHCTTLARVFSFAVGKYLKTCHLTEPKNFLIVGA